MPEWAPGDRKLPLGVEDAIVKFKEWLNESYPEYDAVEFEEIALKSIRRSNGSRLWHYLIRYNGITKGYVVHKPEQFVVMLFDGKVVPAVIERHPLDSCGDSRKGASNRRRREVVPVGAGGVPWCDYAVWRCF